ncbi:MAG: sensor histidine kinase, partial [Sulfobacillus sp.]
TAFVRPNLEPVAVRAFLEQTFPDLRDVCMHHVLEYIGIGSPDITIDADPLLIETTLRILLENADYYATPDTPVTLRLIISSRDVTIQVENLGSEISLEDQSHLFERFYRGHQPASSEHVGLGLSIADAMVSAMGAAWKIESHDGKTSFGIRFSRSNATQRTRSSPSAYTGMLPME